MKIDRIIGRKVYDGFGFPAIACDTILDSGILVTAVLPVSLYAKQGRTDWKELDDIAMSFVSCINNQIAPLFLQQEPNCIEADVILADLNACSIQSNKEAFNFLVVSMSLCRAHALVEHLDLYEFVSCIADTVIIDTPKPAMSILRCVAADQTAPFIEEYSIIPDKKYTVMRAVDIGMVFTHTFGTLFSESLELFEHQGMWHTAKNLVPQECLDAMVRVAAIIEQQYGFPCRIGLKSAASRIYDASLGGYKNGMQYYMTQEIIQSYVPLVASYPIQCIQDGVSVADEVGLSIMQDICVSSAIDYIATHSSDARTIARLASQKIPAQIAVYPEKIGTVTELVELMSSGDSSCNSYVSTMHGSIDSFMVDVAVGVTAPQVFIGGCLGGPSIDQYNRLIMIAEQLQDF